MPLAAAGQAAAGRCRTASSRALGGKRDVRVDVRVVAATNATSSSAVADGRFREDLYYRLNVVAIDAAAAARAARGHPAALPTTSCEVRGAATTSASASSRPTRCERSPRYDWPGNVRELENVVKRVVVLGDEQAAHEVIERRQVSVPARPQPEACVAVAAQADASSRLTSLKDIGRTAAREAERVAILDMLERTRWNRKEAAEILGISYKALLYKIKDNRLDEAS